MASYQRTLMSIDTLHTFASKCRKNFPRFMK